MPPTVSTLCCEVCGRPYRPGERIEAVRVQQDTVVVHVDCKSRPAFGILTQTASPAERGDRDMCLARALIESVDWS